MLFFVPDDLDLDLDILTRPSEGPNTSSLWIWRKSIQQFPRYFIRKQESHSTKNRTLRSSLHAVNTRLKASFPVQAGTRKVNHFGFYYSRRWWGGSGISWTICKSFAPRSGQITVQVPHHSVFTGWMPFLPLNQQYKSTEVVVVAV